MKIKSIPPTYFMAGLFGIIISYFIFPVMNFIPFPVNLTGVVVLISGFILVSQAHSLFEKHSTPHNFDESTKLIIEGIFKYTRNPMYLGMILKHESRSDEARDALRECLVHDGGKWAWELNRELETLAPPAATATTTSAFPVP